jgi:hypothetical protein
LIQPPQKESKIGSKEPQNRQKLKLARGLKETYLSYWKNSLYALTLLGVTISAREISRPQPSEQCKGPHHRWASVRYTTPEGIGYKTGYTTLEGFFTPETPLKESWVPFLDVRGHLFDNGKLAANAGLGVRYMTRSRVNGLNAYYDYRNTKRQHYNQVAAGLESLGRIWDFRINGYLPVGRKQSPFSHPKFAVFEGHSLLVKRDRNFAMKGGNAEVGAHIDHFENAPLYFAGGPYYLTGVGKTTWGGELRGSVDLFRRYLRLEGNVSYDHFFKWIGQAQVSINIPFGRRWTVEKKAGRSCAKKATLYARAIQRADRFEIIPVGKQKSISRAINPATKRPWVFWFVDNTSSSAGTFKDPFPTLLDAQNASSANQGIYVFPGDGTTRGMDNGITLQNGQLFLGAGVPQSVQTTQGKVTISAQASSSPNITNTAGNIVTLASSNSVSGFNLLLQNGHGLAGNAISNLFASQNAFVASAANLDGIHLMNPSGRVFISKSSFSEFSCTNSGLNGNGIYLELDTGSVLNSISVMTSQFINISNPGDGQAGNAILFYGNGGALGVSEISRCRFINITNASTGIFLSMNNGTVVNNLNIQDCAFNSINDSWSILTVTREGIINNLSISNCAFSNASGNLSSIETNIFFGGNINYLNLSGCTFENDLISAPVFVTRFASAAAPSAVNHLSVSNNSFSNSNAAFLLLVCQPDFTGNLSAQIAGNTFMGSSNSPTGYAASIDVGSGTLCLGFIGNTAIPNSNPIPYVFTESSPGVFNRTIGSDSTTNIGQFQINGAVSAPGSCSE